MSRRGRITFLCAGILVQLSVPVAAQMPAAAATQEGAASVPAAGPESGSTLPAGYDEAADLGFKEFELGNYPEARARFLAAERIYPNARISRALGMVEYELRNYLLSIQHLERALASHERALSSDERRDVERLLGQARAYVARVFVRTRPSDAQLRLDGAPITLAPDASLTLQVGDHVLEAQAPDYWSAKRDVRVVGQTDQTIDLQLQPRAKETSESKPLYESPWLWTGVAVLTAGAVTALVIALQPSSRTEVQPPVTTSRTPMGVTLSALEGR